MLKQLFATALLVLAFPMRALASDNYITTYSFNNIAGNINGTNIAVTVPYSTLTTYWNHKVQVSDGATFYTESLSQESDKKAVGTIVVVSSDSEQRRYTVTISKSNFKAPEYSVGKANSIRKDKATISANVIPNDANVSSVRVVYYTKKNQLSYASANREGQTDVVLTGLKENTKYYYYLSVQTTEKTYETSAKSFTTKKSTDSGTSTTNTSNSSTASNKNTTKGTNSDGPGTDAVQDTTIRDQWKLVDGKWLYFGSDGFSKAGWYQVGSRWYYTTKGTNELAMNQWKNIDGKWYYFDVAGGMSSNQWVYSDGWYWTTEHGAMASSQFIDIGGVRYLLDPTGVCVSDKVIYNDNAWKYCKPNSAGIARNEEVIIDGQKYWADQDGRLK